MSQYGINVLMQVSLVVTTTDCRKQPLVFKASIYELRLDLLLVEFRRSKVCMCAWVSECVCV